VRSNEPLEQVTLVPMGSQDLRLIDFPVLGELKRDPAVSHTFPLDGRKLTGWSWFGGGWRIADGQLHTSPTGGAPGFKALIENATFDDLRLEADVTPPPTGDAGVIFRVNKPSIGPDAYEGYYAGVSAGGNEVILGRADGRTWTPLKTVKRAILPDKATMLSVTARGPQIEVRINNDADPIIAITDDRWTSGQAGVRMYTTDNDRAIAAFDNVRITRLSSAAK
jgi:hypothetical protein